MKKFIIHVTQGVEVTLDESKFTPEFMEDFRKSFYPLQTLEDHAKHLAELAAGGRIPTWDEDHFVEGYGPLRAAGVLIEVTYTETEALIVKAAG